MQATENILVFLLTVPGGICIICIFVFIYLELIDCLTFLYQWTHFGNNGGSDGRLEPSHFSKAI